MPLTRTMPLALLLALALPTSAVAQLAKASVEGPATCRAGDRVTVRVTVELFVTATRAEVKLYEKDVVKSDLIETKKIERPLSEFGRPWTETIEFTFDPKKFEVDKTLEIFAKVGSTKSNVIIVKCAK